MLSVAQPGKMMSRLFLIVNGRKGQTTVSLFESLAEKLRERHQVELVAHKPAQSKMKLLFYPRIDTLKKVAWCDQMIVHTPAVTSLQEIILGRLLGKRIVAVSWDVYPESIAYVRGTDVTGILRIYGALETFLLKLSNKILVTNRDYTSHPSLSRFRHLQEFAMWQSYSHELPVVRRQAHDGPLQIAFAGQIDRIRNPLGAAHEIVRVTSRPIVLHVFSADPFPKDGPASLPSDRVTVVEHGFMDEGELSRRLNALDAGLVSLDPAFPLPAFPSKIFSYVNSGLPVLFHGPQHSAVRGFLAETGIGLSLDGRSNEKIDDRIIALKDDFEISRQKFMAATELTWDRLGDIL